ncbi:hypothetical protein Csp2054_12265 [Curtobacterium sp. 'Ferrero']|uniref:2OG-Fe(II) oxygenase n=1 Tax=Curtobacterium sp. 'Ferrero' TaxID=2033654 RepID=UPI000BC6D1CF|nr:2OG-Fe(II) oxygenase [Curtobacterium sp. 'Ferrero']PCN47432.1 hypothetical protein Csp2054_12265 [Curtobacterium sp. 'Ferrero']
MVNDAEHNDAVSRGHRVLSGATDFFSGELFCAALRAVLRDDAVAQVVELPEAVGVASVLDDMQSDVGWEEEGWTIDEDGEVAFVDPSRFRDLPPARRFSLSDTLRKPQRDAFALRGLLAALHQQPVLAAMGVIAGESIEFRTADIARYRPGHYLRRHDDVYDGRLFGLVFFLHASWPDGAGTRLIAEKPDGRCGVVEPRPGTVAVMRLAGHHFHQVEANHSGDWDRYSIAVHFGRARG